MSTTAIALNRFGIGARPDQPLPSDPKAWLKGQLRSPLPSLPGVRSNEDIAADVFRMRRAGLAPGIDKATREKAGAAMAAAVGAVYENSIRARAQSALTTSQPFVERLVWFWSNHFAISTDRWEAMPFAGTLEQEAIRPHVLGRFRDMLVAAEQHPAMLYYLDQMQPVDPNAGMMMAGPIPLNENFAREIMELHTLGVRSGYTQADVVEFAKALTGWSAGGLPLREDIPDLEGETPGKFLFRPALHQKGSRTVLGQTFPQTGADQALAVLDMLAVHPATARHLATKLARHFVADDPPPTLIDRLAKAYLDSGGELVPVYEALIDAPEPWAAPPTPAAAKFKTPWEWVISSVRGLGVRELGDFNVPILLIQLGQKTWTPPSPAGFDDMARNWAGPDALVRRVQATGWMLSVVNPLPDPRQLATKILPGAVTPATAQAIAQAESPLQGVSLLLVSPEFQRR